MSISSSVDNPGRALIARNGFGQSARMEAERPPATRKGSIRCGLRRQCCGRFIDASAQFMATADSSGDVVLWRQSRQLDPVAAMQFPESHVTNVKVIRPYSDLVVIVVVTTTDVHSFSIPPRCRDGYKRAPRRSAGVVSCLYTNGRGIELVSEQLTAKCISCHLVDSAPRPRRRPKGLADFPQYSSTGYGDPSIPSEAGSPSILVGGAYGALAMSTHPLHRSPHLVDFGQHVSSVSAHGATVLAAVQGGLVSFGYGRE